MTFRLFILLWFLVTSIHAAVLNPDALWPVGSRIKVWFLDGDPVAHQLVRSTAAQWSQYGNITFEFYTQPPPQGSHIRVSFTGYDGSMMGVQPLTHDTTPTVRLPSVMHPRLSLDYKKRIILHEFGHVLGFEHEFRHPHWPYGGSLLDQQVSRCRQLLDKSGATSEWQQHCQQLNQPLSLEESLWLPFDDASIMNYPVDAKWLDNRELAIPLALTLSPWDKLAMTLVYPFATKKYDRSAYFYNQCIEPVTVQWKTVDSEHSFSLGLRQTTLAHLELSEPIKVGDSAVLSFYAYDRSARFQWRSEFQSKPWVRLNLKFKPRGERKIVFYCD